MDKTPPPHIEPGANMDAPVLNVAHTELDHDGTMSVYRSWCPVCQHGLLLVRRDTKTFKALRDDYCISCGQRFRYLDEAINGEPLFPPVEPN